MLRRWLGRFFVGAIATPVVAKEVFALQQYGGTLLRDGEVPSTKRLPDPVIDFEVGVATLSPEHTYYLEIHEKSEMVMRIKPGGWIEFGPGFIADEASKRAAMIFAEEVYKHFERINATKFAQANQE